MNFRLQHSEATNDINDFAHMKQAEYLQAESQLISLMSWKNKIQSYDL